MKGRATMVQKQLKLIQQISWLH